MYLMKGVLLDWYSDEKIIFRMIKWNLASKNDSELWKFPILTPLTQKVLQGIKKSFEYAHWDIKIYWISPDTPRNSTTVITLMTGFIFTCEERSVINDTSTCDLTMDFDVSLFEWPESASELQAKLFEF